MNISIISLTEKGRILSGKTAGFLEKFHNVRRYCFRKHTDNSAEVFDNLSELVGKIFNINEGIVFICACGIAVRTISPYIATKIVDPAVVVIDDSGKFVISVLSGHIGGANRLAELLADELKAVPVITTATDTGGKFSPDSFAVANSLIIKDIEISKIIASEILDNKKVGFISEYKYKNIPNKITIDKKSYMGMYIGIQDIKPFPITLQLIPKNIIVGVGCKRGTPCEIIENRINESLISAGISPERISALATINIKASEMGIIEYCKKNKLTPEFYTAEELMAVSGDFTVSDFVLKTTGTDNVCERCAVKSGGKLIMRKNSGSGVTVAVAEKDLIIDFERKIL